MSGGSEKKSLRAAIHSGGAFASDILRRVSFEGDLPYIGFFSPFLASDILRLVSLSVVYRVSLF